jgi:predicted ribosome quality control (RQC) complex YloA/Tae2 family protein
VQNAQRYFEKAKKSRSARTQSGERLKKVQQEAGAASRLLTELERVTSKEGLKEFLTTHADELDEFGIAEQGKEKEQSPFRVFHVEGGFQVLAGKNGENNDLLTMKYAKPHDLWFHARGSGGSHVVLKVGTGKGTPGKRAKEQAAGIAAYYSKMKNAKMVPVAVTEKKYVRKPKGAPPGSVVVEREDMIFAEPRLPEEKQLSSNMRSSRSVMS